MNSAKEELYVQRKNSENNIASFYNEDNAYSLFCSEFDKASSLSELKFCINKVIADFGCSHFLFRRVDDVDNEYALMSTLPDELVRVYRDENFHKDDLMVAYAKYNTQPIFTSQVYQYICAAPFETNLTTDNRAIEKLNSRFGFQEFYSVSLKSYNGQGNVQFAVTCEGETPDSFQQILEPFQGVLRLLCKAIDYVCATRFPRQVFASAIGSINIAPKPLQILYRLANTDTTIGQLANELCISPITAHQHIAGARKALGVKTNIGAIRKAIKLKLIDFH